MRQVRFYFQSSKEARETRQAGRSDCKLDPVPPGGTTLPDPRGVGPLFPCAPVLLEGPLDENEGLWYQHSDDGGALEPAPATEGGLHLPLPAGPGVRTPLPPPPLALTLPVLRCLGSIFLVLCCYRDAQRRRLPTRHYTTSKLLLSRSFLCPLKQKF